MMRRLILAVTLISTLGIAGPAVASVLSQLRSLNDDDFIRVCEWANAGAHDVRSTRYRYQEVEYAITRLDRDTQYAVVRWLSGSGRRDLHNIAITDADIGPERDGADRGMPYHTSVYTVLSDLKRLDNSSFLALTAWARDPSGPVNPMTTGAESIAQDLMRLDGDERRAILQWLRGEGRGELYDLNITDATIGSDRIGADRPPVDRGLTFVNWTLGKDPIPGSDISLYGGFGVARLDGSSVMICVAFRNAAAKTATSILFNFGLSDAQGNVIGSFTFDRKGTFSPNVNIDSWSSYDGWLDNPNHGGYVQNCSMSTALPVPVVMRALYVAPLIIQVDYADGTTWIGHPTNP